MSAVAEYSATEASMAKLISDTICKYVDARTATITDGTACMGSNVVPFALAFKRVNAVEIDPQQYQDLEYNIRDIMHCLHVKLWNMDITSKRALSSLQHDVLYLAPPWGGVHYRDVKHLQLFLSGMRLADVCAQWAVHTRFLALKLPVNFDFRDFRAGVKRPYTEVFCEYLGYDSAQNACVLSEHENRHTRHKPLMVFMILQSDNPSRGAKLCKCFA